jgi:uncharacterized protein (DUF2235 family)
MLKLDWTKVRAIFGGKLSQEQVDGLNIILDTVNSSEFNVKDKRIVAYILATSFWETGRTMQAVKEKTDKTGEAYFFRMYDIKGSRPQVAKRLGNLYPGDGVKFAGRGQVQLTGRTNYFNMGNYLKLDLINNPDLLLDTKVSARVLVHGIIEGSFTGVGINRYVTNLKTDYVNARRIINGVDKANEIANIATQFEKAIVN